jgi:hypothetical protein
MFYRQNHNDFRNHEYLLKYVVQGTFQEEADGQAVVHIFKSMEEQYKPFIDCDVLNRDDLFVFIQECTSVILDICSHGWYCKRFPYKILAINKEDCSDIKLYPYKLDKYFTGIRKVIDRYNPREL